MVVSSENTGDNQLQSLRSRLNHTSLHTAWLPDRRNSPQCEHPTWALAVLAPPMCRMRLAPVHGVTE